MELLLNLLRDYNYLRDWDISVERSTEIRGSSSDLMVVARKVLKLVCFYKVSPKVCLGPCQSSRMELLCENSQRLKALSAEKMKFSINDFFSKYD